MKKSLSLLQSYRRLLLSAAVALICMPVYAMGSDVAPADSISQKEARKQEKKQNPKRFIGRIIHSDDSEFFKTDEAARIADQILLWQRNTGGWPKNIDMVSPMTDEQRAFVAAEKDRRDDSTIDNNATTNEMTYLAHMYQATGEARYLDGFLRGLDYLLAGQYPNGGWPQFWPEMRDYQPHITYNDNAMVNTMLLLRDIANDVEPYNGLCDSKRKKQLRKAFDKGIECILATQIMVNGEPTVWCQQHDHETLLPAPARAYELPSFCSSESASIVRLLMNIPNPSKKVKRAVHGAMAWFDKYKLTGLEYRHTLNNGVWEASLVKNPDSEMPLWGRFYDLDHNLPYVCDRDGIPRRRLEDIGAERRNGYGWYTTSPALLYELYNDWADRYDPAGKVAISLETKGANENGTLELGVVPAVDESKFDAIVNRGGSIQAAIEQAPEQGVEPFKILVKKGLYNEKVVIDRPNIVLVGENRDSCIIVGAEAGETRILSEYRGKPVHHGILVLTEDADDCLISGLTVINNYGTTVTNTTSHQFSVYGSATRTIILNSNIIADGNDALSLWGKGDDGKGGMYYHADLLIRCPGVDFICPRGRCYATRCKFLGDTRAILWHDGRGDIDNKFVVKDSEFDAYKPTPLGRYHHDSQFILLNCHLSKNILDTNIDHAYRADIELGRGKPFDPCPWGQRVYFYNCSREGGHSGWLDNNLSQAAGAPEYFTVTAPWTFDYRWDPEARIRDLWDVVAY